jgi:prepilin-type N-terminal cleavage/methylation domain-containing protein
MKRENGFTIIEVVVAILVLSIGLLAMVGSTAMVTRMIARGQRSATAAIFASQRLEQLRASACTVRPNGADTLYRGGTWTAVNSWAFVNAGNSTWRIKLTSKYKTAQGRTRTDSTETEISCRI